MIKVDNLKKDFDGFQAVDGITFSVSPGDVLGFLGPNGAGKSTTMKMLTGFIKPSAGRVSLYGHDVLTHSVAARQQVGYLPEGAPAWDDMTPERFLAFIAQVRGLPEPARQERVAEVIRLLELEAVCGRPIEKLSKGYRRRVGIAQAILHDPRILILDEPTDGLDPNQKHQVRELIKGLAQDRIVIVSTHILEEVTAVCTRAIIIANGRILADCTPAELEARSRYHKAVTLQLAAPDEKQVTAALAALEGVLAVETHPDQRGRYTLVAQDGVNLFQPVCQLVQEKQWSVDEMFMERGRLDDVFRQLTAPQKNTTFDARVA